MNNENELTEVIAEEENLPAAAEAESPADEPKDTAALLEEDISSLGELFPELSDITSITELQNPTRYAALRDLGLSPKEAYLATSERKMPDNRAHLRPSVPAYAGRTHTQMTSREWNEARALFEDLSDSEIEKLYRKVTK